MFEKTNLKASKQATITRSNTQNEEFSASLSALTTDKKTDRIKNQSKIQVSKGEAKHGLSQARDFSKPFGTKTWEFEDNLCGKVIITADVFKHDNLAPWGYYIKDKYDKPIELPGWDIGQTGKADAKAVILRAYKDRKIQNGKNVQLRGVNAVDRPEYNSKRQITLRFYENSITSPNDKITSYTQQMGQSLMLFGVQHKKTNNRYEINLADNAIGAKQFALAEAVLGGERRDVSVIPSNASREFIHALAIERKKITAAKNGDAIKELASAFWECAQSLSIAHGALRGGKIKPPSSTQLQRMAIARDFYYKAQNASGMEQRTTNIIAIAPTAPRIDAPPVTASKNIVPIKRKTAVAVQSNGKNTGQNLRSHADQDRHTISAKPSEHETIPRSAGEAIRRQDEEIRNKKTDTNSSLNSNKDAPRPPKVFIFSSGGVFPRIAPFNDAINSWSKTVLSLLNSTNSNNFKLDVILRTIEPKAQDLGREYFGPPMSYQYGLDRKSDARNTILNYKAFESFIPTTLEYIKRDWVNVIDVRTGLPPNFNASQLEQKLKINNSDAHHLAHISYTQVNGKKTISSKVLIQAPNPNLFYNNYPFTITTFYPENQKIISEIKGELRLRWDKMQKIPKNNPKVVIAVANFLYDYNKLYWHYFGDGEISLALMDGYLRNKGFDMHIKKGVDLNAETFQNTRQEYIKKFTSGTYF
jgi:hypothetical protein